MKEIEKDKAAKYNKWVVALSIIIPIVVAALFGIKIPNATPLTFLPPIYAFINGLTAILLITALWAVKNRKLLLHERLMKTALLCSIAFLLMYVAYHMTSDSTPFGGEGVIRYVYFFILITHIVLSILVIPFVLLTYVRAITKDFDRHKKLARIAYPLWLYVAISGVLVYLMISPYYQ
ncbi:MAG: DUF420 domain-containing protein [Bacteroidia bacterium]|nr:DUF420 domain-containing protein [Bacteroidia bacterium]MBT8270228.1 DUF420 domain-containing protein [Bacteroidia bacterium]NNF82555.1 DUF420 domain-containing protein [Flavobacteriaceae bacterium]NNL78859.1 DUF420 domain-containing protein [Flavobacteriaceae bacterium]